MPLLPHQMYSLKYFQKLECTENNHRSNKVFLHLQFMYLPSAYAFQEEFGFKMNMLDIGGGFTGSELQLEEVCNVLEVETLTFEEIEVFNLETAA